MDRARLMLQMLRHVEPEQCFAVKGGTAINFFVRDMPRLSVDIDLTYLPVEPRPDSLRKISEALSRIKERLVRAIPGIKVQEARAGGMLSKLSVRGPGGLVKVEPNLVLRGTVYAPKVRSQAPRVTDAFKLAISVRTLSDADLYGGKICAALDRQHPRDLFDVKLLLEAEGITAEIRRAFVVYLASGDRPMHEIIEPRRQERRQAFEREFAGMTREPVEYHDLVEARERLIRSLQQGLTGAERRFLVSIKEGEPEWGLLGLEGLDKLPGLQWKLANVRKMKSAKHQEQLRRLKERLGLQ